MKNLKFWEAVATLVGMIVGAGVLGLPFVVAKVGLWPSIILMIVLGLALMLLNLMFTEVILRTRMSHQIVGYAKKYLGITARNVEMFSMLFNGFGVLLAYIIGEGLALSALFGGDPYIYSLLFLGVSAFILYFGLNLVKVVELWMVVGFIIIIFVILGTSSGAINPQNYFTMDLGHSFLAYGVILFAFGGAAAVVPLRHVLKGHEKKIKKAVIYASILPIFIYILFSLVVVGVTGAETTDVATVGLGNVIGPYMIIFGNLFAVFAMGTSFLTKGIILQELFRFDFRLKPILAWLVVVSVPLIIFIAGLRNFIQTLSVVGGFEIGITGTILILMFWKAKEIGNRKPEFSLPKFRILGVLLIVMFILGAGYTVYTLFQ